MQFREWFFLIESKEEKTLAKELAEDSYDDLNSVIPQNTKESDPLLLLAAYYLTQSKNIAQTKQDIQDYITLVKNNKMPLIKVDLNNKKPAAPFDSYLHWTQVIHGHQAEEKSKFAKKYTPTDQDFQNEKPIATSPDGLIKVYQSNSPNQCIILGKGKSFCVSQPGNTMWKSYRDTKGSTFYFVYDNSRQDNLSTVVVDANDNGLELTDVLNTTGIIQNPYNPEERDDDPDIYMNYLESKGINTSIFKNLPKTNQEIEEDEKLGKENQDLNWFVSLPPQEKYNYIGRGHWLTNEQFDYLWNNKFYSLLEQYVKTGLQLNDYQIDKIITNKDLKNNYLHNRIIADQHDGMNKKEYELLNQKQKDKLFENLSDKQKLIKAIVIGHLELVKNLVEKGVSIEKAVVIAAANGSSDVLKYLVENGYEIGNTVESAAANGYLDIVMYLVGEKGARIGNAVKNAAENGYLDIVKYLVEKGADIGNAVGFAARRGHLDIVKYLVPEKGAGHGGAVESAAANGYLDIVKYLVEKGADIGNTVGNAVEMAAENGYLDIVKYLVEKGARIGTASFKAAKKGHTDIVRYLRTIQART